MDKSTRVARAAVTVHQEHCGIGQIVYVQELVARRTGCTGRTGIDTLHDIGDGFLDTAWCDAVQFVVSDLFFA